MADISIANGTYTFDFRGVEASEADCLQWLKSYASVLSNRRYATVLYDVPTPVEGDGVFWNAGSERIASCAFDAEGRYSFESNLEWAETDKDENDALAKMPGLCILVSYDECIDSSCVMVDSEVKISVGRKGEVSLEALYINERWFGSRRDYQKVCGDDDFPDEEFHARGYQPDEFFSARGDLALDMTLLDFSTAESKYESSAPSV